jgi:hypothetical protein
MSWAQLDWDTPISESALVVPEAHYLALDGLGLDPQRRVALNRLFACFSCELFIHFEGYVIRYLERHGDRLDLARPAQERFAQEERLHSEMFQRLLHRLRPSLYPEERAETRFVRWSRADDRVLAMAPPGTFFVLAWLFEEITLYMPPALEARPDQCSALLRRVMELHAEDERPHVAIDRKVLTERSAPRLLRILETWLALPILLFVDLKVGRAWRELVALAERELGLSPEQRRLLLARGLTQSDRWGMESFLSQLREQRLAGKRLLCWALQRQLNG